MYHSVTDPETLRLVKRAQKYSDRILVKVKSSLKNRHGIVTMVHIIGSTKKGLITRNGFGPIDFDYNLEILGFGEEYNDDCEKLIKLVRGTFNDVIRRDMTTGIRGAGNVADTASALSSRPMSFTDEPEFMFMFHVGLIFEDSDGIWRRLIHDKEEDLYEWKALPDMDRVYMRYDIVTSLGGYEEVLQKYIEAENKSLERSDPYRNAFVCFAEAVNGVYDDFVRTGRIRTAAGSGLYKLP